MFGVTEVAGQLDIRRLGKKLLNNERLFEDYMKPCPQGCGFCMECQVSYETILHVLKHPNCTVFQIKEDGEECGVAYFTGSMFHAHFFDGKLFGRAPAVDAACERM